MAPSVGLMPELLPLLAGRFKALGESSRLQLLDAMRAGERTVTELSAVTGLGNANVSKHLGLLHRLGFLTRRKKGLLVYYGLADGDVSRLCDIMCGKLRQEAESHRRVLTAR